MHTSSPFRPGRFFARVDAVIGLSLAALLVPFPVAAQVAPVIVAPNSGNTRSYITPGGVPVVDIDTANGAGLSHNRFTNYNVPSQGLVLNNTSPTQFSYSSQIAGNVTANFNLKDPARIILNEVVAPNATTIAGFTEIVGGKADLVVANPHGIAIRGGGFINTDRVTLATGTPLIDASGRLTGLRVTQGELSVSGSGLNAANVGLLDLLARSIKLDGQVNAQDLVVAAGANDFDYTGRTVAANDAAADAAPSYAVDSSLVGGMYANRIRLIATDAGVGVRMLGEVAATADDLTLDAAGRVQFANKTYAERDARVFAGGGIEIAGAGTSLTTKRDLSLDARDSDVALTNAALVAGRDLAIAGGSLTDTSTAKPSDSNRFAVGALRVTTTGATSIQASSYGAGAEVAVTAGGARFSNGASIYSGADSAANSRGVSIRISQGDLDTGNALIQSPAALTLTADRGSIAVGLNADGIRAATDLTIAAATSVTNAGNITAGATLEIHSLDSASPAIVYNRGNLIAGGALQVGGTADSTAVSFNNGANAIAGGLTVGIRGGSTDNSGTIQGTRGVSLDLSGALSNGSAGAILTAGEAGRDVTIDAASVTNAGAIQSSGALALTTSGEVNNSGVIGTLSAAQGGVGSGIMLAAGALQNSGAIQSAGTLDLRTHRATGTALANRGLIQATGAADLSVGSGFENAAAGSLLSGGALTIDSGAGAFAFSNAGRLQAAQNLRIGSAASEAAMTQTDGAIALAGGALELHASTADNAGTLQAGDELRLSASGAIANRAGGAILTVGSPDKGVALTGASLTNAGQVQATGAIAVNVAASLTNSGTILAVDSNNGGAGRGISFNAQNLANSGKIVAPGAIGLTLGSQVDNQKGGVIVTSDAVTVSAAALVNAGTIQAATGLTASVEGGISNTVDGAMLTAGGDPAKLSLSAASLTNGGTIQASGALAAMADDTANSGRLLAQGNLDASTSTLTNSGLIQAGGRLVLTTAQLFQNASAGQVLGGGEIELVSGAGAWKLDNAGRIQAAGVLTLGGDAAEVALNNSDKAIVYAGNALAVTASSVENTGVIRGSSRAAFDVSGDFMNQSDGVVATAGVAGAELSIQAGSLTNASTAQIQSAGAFQATIAGSLSNSGVLLTMKEADGGSDGAVATSSSHFDNSGTVESAGTIGVVATATGGTSFNNSGRLQAVGAVVVTAPTRQQVTEGGVIQSGAKVVLRSGSEAFTLSNAGLVQAASDLTIGEVGQPVDLENSGTAVAGGVLGVMANTIQNSKILQGAAAVELSASGALANSGTIAATATGSRLDVDAASISNSGSGFIQSEGDTTLNTSDGIGNSGSILAGSRLSMTSESLGNSGVILGDEYLGVTTRGSDPATLHNTGKLISHDGLSIKAANGIENAGDGETNGVISGGGYVNILSGTGADFYFTNNGLVQAQGSVLIGNTTEPTSLLNQGKVLAGSRLDIGATAVANIGTLQAGKQASINATGNVGNSGTIATPDGDIALTAAKLTNDGTISAGRADELGATVSVGMLAVTTNGAEATTLLNTGVLRATGEVTLTANNGLSNSSSGVIHGGGDVTIVAGSDSGFVVTNGGVVESDADLTIGTSGRPAALTNLLDAKLLAGGSLGINATTLSNAGTIQGASAVSLSATGSLTNAASGRILTTGGAGADLSATAASIENAGTLQSTGAITAQTPGLVTNTGTFQTTGSGAIDISGASIANAGAGKVQSGGTLTLVAGADITNAAAARLQAASDLSLTAPHELSNQGEILGGRHMTIAGGSTAFTIMNDGRMQAAQNFTFGSTTARASVVNNPVDTPAPGDPYTKGVIQSGGTMTGYATDLTNHGFIQSGGMLTLNASGALTNTSDASLLMAGAGASNLNVTAASLNNTGAVQSKGALTATVSGAMVNSGEISTKGAGALGATAATLDNSGMIESASTLGLTATNTSGTTITNSGTMLGATAVSITAPGGLSNTVAGKITSNSAGIAVRGGNAAFALTNDGAIQAADTLDIGADSARANVTNNGFLQSDGAMTTKAVTFTNNGTTQAGGALQLDATGAIVNAVGARLLTNGDDNATLTLGGASLSNSGAIQSTGAASATLNGALTNSGTFATSGTAAITANAGTTLTNSGTIDSAGVLALTTGTTFTNMGSGVIRSGDAATLTTGTSFTNQAGGKIASADALTVKGSSAFAFDNSGLLQAGGAVALGENTRRAAVTNNAGAKVQAGGDLDLFASSLTNSGSLQAGGSGSFILNSGVTVTNSAAGKILIGDALTIDTSGGGFTISNAGTIQSSGLLTVGGTGRAATINQIGTGSRLFAGSFAVTAGAITNAGMIIGAEGGTLTGTTFLNSGSGSRFIGATDSGATTLTLSGTLTNEGAMFSSDDFTINAATIANTSTGGLSSLEDLTLNATAGDVHNYSEGALYAGGKLTLSATDDIVNEQDATIDTGGDFAATASGGTSEFLNQGQINIGGSGSITARSFKNIMAGAENLTRTTLGLATSGSTVSEDNYWIFGDTSWPAVQTDKWYPTTTPSGDDDYDGSLFDDRSATLAGYFYRKDVFSGIGDPVSYFADKIKPQIAATNLTIDGFDTAKNIGAVLSATGTLNINGRTGGSSFLNDALTLEIQKWSYHATWWYDYTVGDYDWWNPSGENPDDTGNKSDISTTITSTQDYFTIGAGIHAGTLHVTNVGSLDNVGSPFGHSPDETSANGDSPSSLSGAASVAGAGLLGATAKLSTDAAGSLSATNAGAAGSLTAANATGGAVLSGVSLLERKFVEGSDPNEIAKSADPDHKKLQDGGSSSRFEDGVSAFAAAANRFKASDYAALANALKNARVSLGGLSLKLPSNPNGYFVPSADPQAKFLVSVNDTFGIDTSSAVGSEKLLEELGVNPDYTQKRLGDASYETYLVRQQLVDQLGGKFLAGQKNEAAQMEMLMANAAGEARKLGLQLGVPPTADQLANLTEDMVWMVDQVVGGQHVLAPQVYLSSKTKSLFEAGNAVIAGNTVDLDVGNLTNTGGSISGSDSLSIKAKNDITNSSGSISGGDVALKAGGNITNETLTRGNADSTTVGRTASIAATGDLDVDAGKNVKIIGADLKAGGDASLAAGGEIVVDTVQKKSKTISTTSTSGIGSSKTTTVTNTDVKNQASNLDFGGNLKIKSGGDTTIAGSNVKVGENLDTDVGGDLNVLARQDQHTVKTETSESGLGVGGEGSIYGTSDKTTTDFTGTNFGSTLKVGGNANINAGKTLTLEGSDVDIKGDGNISATDVKILDGKDEHSVTTTEKTTGFGAFTDSSSSAGAEASATGYGRTASASASTSSTEGKKSEAGTSTDHARLSGQASASANAEGSGEVTVGVRTTETNSLDYESKSHASTLKIGGNATVNAKNKLTVRGSDIDVGGDATINAKDQEFLAGQDVTYSTTSSKTLTAGLAFSGEGSAEASAEANAGPTNLNGSANAEAKGEVGAGIKVDSKSEDSSSLETKARVSTIKTGGSLTRNAENKITDVGTSIDVGGDLTQKAKTIESLAAADTSQTTNNSSEWKVQIGVYADAHAEAGAEGGTGVASASEAKAEAGAGVSAGGKIGFSKSDEASNSSSSTAVVSNIKVGGKVTSTSSGKTTLEGTNITSGGDVTIEAKSLDYKAAKNTASESSNSSNLDLSLKGGVGAGASASTEDGGDAGYGPQGSIGVGYGKKGESSSSSEAVTGSLNSGGKLTIKTSGDARFEGTNLESADEAKISAGGNVTFDAARNTSESSSNNLDVSVDLSASKTGKGAKKSVGVGIGVGYGNESESSNEAVAGSVKSGAGLTITSGGNTSFEGTDLESKGDTNVQAGGDVTFKQATSTSSKQGVEASLEIEAGGESEKGDSGTSKSRSAGLAIEGGYSTENESTAKTSSIKSGGKLNISSGRDTTLQGVEIDATGDANVTAGGNLNITAKEESSTSFGVSGGLSAGAESTKGGEGNESKKSAGVDFAIEGQSDVTQTGATIKSGGTVNLSSGKDTTLVGTQVEAGGDINVAAGGKVTQTAAQSASVGGSIGLSASAETEKKTPAGGAGQDSKAGESKGEKSDEKPEGPKKGVGVTDAGFNFDLSSEDTSLKAGTGGKVNIQENVKSTPPPKSSSSGASDSAKADKAPPSK